MQGPNSSRHTEWYCNHKNWKDRRADFCPSASNRVMVMIVATGRHCAADEVVRCVAQEVARVAGSQPAVKKELRVES